MPISFLEAGVPILRECLRGYNGTILAYGQSLGHASRDHSDTRPKSCSTYFGFIAKILEGAGF